MQQREAAAIKRHDEREAALTARETGVAAREEKYKANKVRAWLCPAYGRSAPRLPLAQ